MKFSIVIPLYNKENQISATLNSVLAQTFQDYEIIVVNDGSTDGSVAAVETFDDPRIRLIHQNNAGVSAARNKGIEEAEGEYIALLDGDDEWKPEYLETISDLISRYPEAQVFATSYEFKDQNGNISYPVLNNLKIEKSDGILSNYFEVACCSSPPLNSINIVSTKHCFDSIGRFPVGVKLGEDLITWARLACKYTIAYSTKPLAIYHFSSQDKRLVPQKTPDQHDIVGEEFNKLLIKYDTAFLKEYVARWHKIRMVTFVQFCRRKEARIQYNKIKKLIKPGFKEKIWFLLSYMPIQIIHLYLRTKNKLK